MQIKLIKLFESISFKCSIMLSWLLRTKAITYTVATSLFCILFYSLYVTETLFSSKYGFSLHWLILHKFKISVHMLPKILVLVFSDTQFTVSSWQKVREQPDQLQRFHLQRNIGCAPLPMFLGYWEFSITNGKTYPSSVKQWKSQGIFRLYGIQLFPNDQ